jgi:SAM-dependent methyltransferase
MSTRTATDRTAALTIDDPAYFDRLAAVEAAHWWSLAMWRIASNWLDDALRGRRGLQALDVGCGTGLAAVRLAARPEIAHVVGVEPSPAAIAHARRRHGFPLVLGDALALPFAARSFDVVTCFDVLQHLPPGGVDRAVGELRRILRPGSIVVLRSNSEKATDGGSRLAQLAAVFARSGFQIRRASHANCLPALAVELRARLWRRHPGRPAGGGLRIGLRHPALNRLMGAVAAVEALAVGRFAARLPFGHSTMIMAQAVSKRDGEPARKGVRHANRL